MWHALKPNLPQFTLTYASQPIEDYEWLDSNHVLIAVKRSVCIKQIDEHAVRPYRTLVPSGIDFSIQGEFSFVNDQLVPDASQYERRDPDKFLQILEEQARTMFRENCLQTSKQQVGVMSVHKFDSNEIMEMLINEYQFRGDGDPETLCTYNQSVVESLGLDDLALSWKSLAQIAKQISVLTSDPGQKEIFKKQPGAKVKKAPFTKQQVKRS